MTLAITLWLGRLQPHFIANADQFAQRLDVDSGFAKKNLHVAAAQVLQTIRRLKKLVDDVLAHVRRLLGAILAQTRRAA